MVGCCGLVYTVIEPDLKTLDLVAERILLDLQKAPTSWIDEVRQRRSQLVESFYLTTIDRDKVGGKRRGIYNWHTVTSNSVRSRLSELPSVA